VEVEMTRSTLLAATLAALLFTALPPTAARADVAVSFSFFHDNLSPYGHWVTVGSYGRCWYPAGVSAGWQPYTVGHWGWGDYGWTWVSADPWGDWTYRYGTWTFQPPWGWVWVPGYVWAPAWVTWSYTNDYIGWAPIPPTFSFSVGGYFGSPVVVNRSAYCFVPRRGFATANINVVNVRVPVRQNQALLARSENVTRFPVSGGVVRNEGLALRSVERASAARVQRVSTRQMRAAPARIEASRSSGRKISVAAPAVTRQQASAPAERSRAQTDRRARIENEARRDVRPKRESAPASEWRSAPQPRKSTVRERPASRPSAPETRARERREPQARAPETRKSRPSDSSVRRPARPSQPESDARVSASSSREKARAVRSSAPREPAASARPRKSPRPRQEGSTSKQTHSRASEKERGRPDQRP
jgi:hypothetical protein